MASEEEQGASVGNTGVDPIGRVSVEADEGRVPAECPKCRARPFEPFLRGQVVRFGWFGLRKRTLALICWACKEIVGYE